MKRITALMLILMLLCAGIAQAAEWPEGTSPSKPYTNVPELNLDEQLGYMMFYPREGNQVQSACQRLYVYVPREDVAAGEGELYLFTADETMAWSTPMNNADAITLRGINEAELIGLMWGSGVCFEILLPKTLELGETYYVNMERGAVVTADGLENPQIGGKSWAVKAEGDFGVSGMEYRRPLGNGKYEEQVIQPEIGDEIRFDLVLGGDAAIAAIYGYNDSVDFLTTTFEASCEVIGEVTGENLVWGVMFLDAYGNELDRVEFW